MKIYAIALSLSFLIAAPKLVSAQGIRCTPAALELGISEIPGLVEAIYRPKGHLDVQCINGLSTPVILNVVVYDGMPQPHRLGKDRSRDHIFLWIFSNESRTVQVGDNAQNGLSNKIHLLAGERGGIRFPLFPELHLPKVLPSGDWSHPMTLKIQWKIERQFTSSVL